MNVICVSVEISGRVAGSVVSQERLLCCSDAFCRWQQTACGAVAAGKLTAPTVTAHASRTVAT